MTNWHIKVADSPLIMGWVVGFFFFFFLFPWCEIAWWQFHWWPLSSENRGKEWGRRVSARMVMRRGLWRWPSRRGHRHQSLEVLLSLWCRHSVCPPYECIYVVTENNHGWRQGFICQSRNLYCHQPPLGSIYAIVPASKSGSLMPEQPSVGTLVHFQSWHGSAFVIQIETEW